ncbi:MAG: hypothetical protein U5N58_06635 [Actinomycetota bacterium]|nr:hypothetical protein [Actinomycetota bacterium]
MDYNRPFYNSWNNYEEYKLGDFPDYYYEGGGTPQQRLLPRLRKIKYKI